MNKTRVEPLYLNTITYRNRKTVLGLVSSLREVFGQHHSASSREWHCTFLKSNLSAILAVTLLLFLVSIAYHIGKCIRYLDDLGMEFTLVEDFSVYLNELKSNGMVINLQTYHYETSLNFARNVWNQIAVLPSQKHSFWYQNFIVLLDHRTCKEFENKTIDVFKLNGIDLYSVLNTIVSRLSYLRYFMKKSVLLSSVAIFVENINYGWNNGWNNETIYMLVSHVQNNEIPISLMNNESQLKPTQLFCDDPLNGNFTSLLNNFMENILISTQDIKTRTHVQHLTITILLLTWMSSVVLTYYASINSIIRALQPSPEFQSIYSRVNSQYNQITQEKEQSELLLHQMLPSSVADKLIAGQPVEAETFEEVTVYFSDIVGFNDVALSASPIQIVNLLNSIYGYVFLTSNSY